MRRIGKGDSYEDACLLIASALGMVAASRAFGAEDLKRNLHLDDASDSVDGTLITGSNFQAGIEAGKPNWIIIYSDGCYNSKSQTLESLL